MWCVSSLGFCGGWFIWFRWLPVVIVPGGGGRGGCRVPRWLRARRGFASRWRSVAGWCPYQWTHSAVATSTASVWTAGCFSDSACLCFRLPSLSSGARFRPRWGCDTLGLSEGGRDYISARSMRQYPWSPCPSWGKPFGGVSHS